MRHQYNICKNMLSKDNKLGKSTIKHVHNCKGRSSITGHITAWHRGGGAKQQYREIEFGNKPYESIVLTTMYDPYRSAFINFNFELNEKKFFRTVATDGCYPGTILTSSAKPEELKLGTRTKLKNIPPGSVINNLAIGTHKAKYIRSAGTSGTIVAVNDDKAQIKMPSGQVKTVTSESFATIGVCSNLQHNLVVLGELLLLISFCIYMISAYDVVVSVYDTLIVTSLHNFRTLSIFSNISLLTFFSLLFLAGKAGRRRHMGWRPHVRGIAMNPVDHPHGEFVVQSRRYL